MNLVLRDKLRRKRKQCGKMAEVSEIQPLGRLVGSYSYNLPHFFLLPLHERDGQGLLVSQPYFSVFV